MHILEYVQQILDEKMLICLRYSKGSKISNTFLFPFSNKQLVIRTEITKMLVRISNREDPDQTASEEAV